MKLPDITIRMRSFQGLNFETFRPKLNTQIMNGKVYVRYSAQSRRRNPRSQLIDINSYTPSIVYPKPFGHYLHSDIAYVPLVAIMTTFIDLLIKEVRGRVSFREKSVIFCYSDRFKAYNQAQYKEEVHNVLCEEHSLPAYGDTTDNATNFVYSEVKEIMSLYNLDITQFSQSPLEYITSIGMPLQFGMSPYRYRKLISESVFSALDATVLALEKGLVYLPEMRIYRYDNDLYGYSRTSASKYACDRLATVNFFTNPFYSGVAGSELCITRSYRLNTFNSVVNLYMGYGIAIADNPLLHDAPEMHLMNAGCGMVRDNTWFNSRQTATSILAEKLGRCGIDINSQYLPVSVLAGVITTDRARVRELLMLLLLGRELPDDMLRLELDDSVTNDSVEHLHDIATGLNMEVLPRHNLFNSLLVTGDMDEDTLQAFLTRSVNNAARSMSYKTLRNRNPNVHSLPADMLEGSLCNNKVMI